VHKAITAKAYNALIAECNACHAGIVGYGFIRLVKQGVGSRRWSRWWRWRGAWHPSRGSPILRPATPLAHRGDAGHCRSRWQGADHWI